MCPPSDVVSLTEGAGALAPRQHHRKPSIPALKVPGFVNTTAEPQQQVLLSDAETKPHQKISCTPQESRHMQACFLISMLAKG